MANCPKCQNEYTPGVNFCPWCGEAVGGSGVQSAVAVVERAVSPDPEPEPTLQNESQLAIAEECDSQAMNPETECEGSAIPVVEPLQATSPRLALPGKTVAAPPQAGAATPPPDGSHDSQPPAPVHRPKLVTIRGQMLDHVYPIYEGRNTIGRFADRPVDIDLVNQEAEGQVWSSRLHAAIIYSRGEIRVEDLNSLNGTWLNGVRVQPGQQRVLRPGDVVQIGTVQLKLVVD